MSHYLTFRIAEFQKFPMKKKGKDLKLLGKGKATGY